MDVSEIKLGVSIYDVLDMFKIRYQSRDMQENIICPFHVDTQASCRIYPDVGKLHCFGACSRSFDVLDIVQEIESCNLPEAIKILQDKFGIQELQASYKSKFWRSLEGVKKNKRKRDRMDLAYAMAREAVNKYWPTIDWDVLALLWSEFDVILEDIRNDEDEGTDKLREWYDRFCGKVGS